MVLKKIIKCQLKPNHVNNYIKCWFKKDYNLKVKIIELGKVKKQDQKNRCVSKRYILNRKIQTGCNDEKCIPALSKCTKYISISDKVDFRIKILLIIGKIISLMIKECEILDDIRF